MQKYYYVLAVSFILMVCFFIKSTAVFAQQEGRAGILLTPTRVVLEGRDRSGMVSVANNGSASGTYRAELVNRRMLPEGGFENVEVPQEGEKFADEFLRVSPRSFKLAPGKHQNVRILARKPAGLEEGEYRSHLRFILVPDEPTVKEPSSTEALSISIRANFGMSIPVIVRHGAISSDIKVAGLKYQPVRDGEAMPSLSFELVRGGKASVYGDLQVVYQPTSGSEVVVKNMGGIAVYAPNPKRIFTIPLDIPEGVSIGKGTLKVTYREKEDNGGAIIAQGSLSL